MVRSSTFGRGAGLAGLIEPHRRVGDPEDVELDLEAGGEAAVEGIEAGERAARHAAGAEGHGRAVGEAQVAQDPGGFFGAQGRTRQVVGSAIRRTSAAPCILRHVEAAAGGEDRKHRAMRRVLGEQRRRQRDARGAGRPIASRPDQRLAAQDAVLVGEDEADHLDPPRVDLGDETGGRGLRLARPSLETLRCRRSWSGLDLSAPGGRGAATGVALAPIAFGVAAAVDNRRS